MNMLGLLFVQYSIIAFVLHKEKAVFTVIGIFLGLSTLRAFINDNTYVAVPAMVVAMELVIEVHALSTFAQMAGALLVVVIGFALSKYDSDLNIRVELLLIWFVWRVVRATSSEISAEYKWRTSQIMLAIIVLIHLMRRFANRPSDQTISHAVFFQAPAHLETPISAGMTMFVFLMYAQDDVIPRDMNIWLIALPVVYNAVVTLPHEYSYNHKGGQRTEGNRVAEAFAGIAALAVIGLAYTYDRPVTEFTIYTDPCDTALTNLFTCAGSADVYVSGQCCMPNDYMRVPAKLVVRAAPIDCTPMFLGPGNKDCCGQTRTVETESLMSGLHACMCNAMVAGSGNKLLPDNTCTCGDAWTGVACEVEAN
jgi:hypothetical protein